MVLAVSDLAPAVILGGILCAVNAVFMTAAIYAFRKYWYIGVFWGAAVIAGILLWGTALWFMLLILVNMIIAVMFLQNADGFSFYLQKKKTAIQSNTIDNIPYGAIFSVIFNAIKIIVSIWLRCAVWLVCCLFFRADTNSICCANGFCDSVHKYADCDSAVVRPITGTGCPIFARTKEEILYPVLSVYFSGK